MELLTFNVQDGYTEALLRGLRASFISREEYDSMRDCTNLSDFKMVLEESDYLAFVQAEPSPIKPAVVRQRMREKLAKELEHIKAQAAEGLYYFLEKVSHKYMIENTLNLIEVIKNRGRHKEKPAPDPLGYFRGIEDILRYEGDEIAELYEIVLIDSPVGEYFSRFMEDFMDTGDAPLRNLHDFNRSLEDVTPQFLRILLKKMWLEDLFGMCSALNGTSKEIIQDLLKFEADCMSIEIIYNSFTSDELNKPEARESDRKNLCPNFGYLYPDCEPMLTQAFDLSSLRKAVESYPLYSEMLKNVPDPMNQEEMNDDTRKSLDDYMYEVGVRKYSLAFDEQFHYACFYAYLKLKEQEIRNVAWLSDMVDLNKDRSIPAWRKYENLVPFQCLQESN